MGLVRALSATLNAKECLAGVSSFPDDSLPERACWGVGIEKGLGDAERDRKVQSFLYICLSKVGSVIYTCLVYIHLSLTPFHSSYCEIPILEFSTLANWLFFDSSSPFSYCFFPKFTLDDLPGGVTI